MSPLFSSAGRKLCPSPFYCPKNSLLGATVGLWLKLARKPARDSCSCKCWRPVPRAFGLRNCQMLVQMPRDRNLRQWRSKAVASERRIQLSAIQLALAAASPGEASWSRSVAAQAHWNGRGGAVEREGARVELCKTMAGASSTSSNLRQRERVAGVVSIVPIHPVALTPFGV